MKITHKNTKYGVPLIILGIIFYLLFFVILLEPMQARYANTPGPSALPMFLFAGVWGWIAATLTYVGFSFAKHHKNLYKHEAVPFSAKQLFGSTAWRIQSLLFIIVTIIATNWWLNDL